MSSDFGCTKYASMLIRPGGEDNMAVKDVTVYLDECAFNPDMTTLSENQKLLPSEMARHLSLICYLVTRSDPTVDVTVLPVPNAQFLSDSDQLPFFQVHSLKGSKQLCNGLQSAMSIMPRKGLSQSHFGSSGLGAALSGPNIKLEQQQKHEDQLLFNWINDVFFNLIIYTEWSTAAAAGTGTDEDTGVMQGGRDCHNSLQRMYRSRFPWPLSHIIAWQQQRRANAYLSAWDWSDRRSLSSLLTQQVEPVLQCICSLLREIDLTDTSQLQFFKKRNDPGGAEALIYGHIMTFLLYKDTFKDSIGQLLHSKAYSPIVDFVYRLETLFPRLKQYRPVSSFTAASQVLQT